MRKITMVRDRLFATCVICILLLAILLRFIHYSDRWGLAYDQSHDAIIARYALETGKIPLLGPFSSAGPFQTGGEWYWLIMFGTALYPVSVLSPWVFMSLLYVLFVLLIIIVAREFVDKEFALITGSFAAVSTAQITQGTNLTNQSPMALFGLLSVWFAIRFLRTQKKRYLLLLSLSVGIAASIHLQGAVLGLLLIVTVVTSIFYARYKPYIKMKKIVYYFLITVFGLLLPWVPVFIADSGNNFSNIYNMMNYYLHDQYNIPLEMLERRWLTFGGIFLPNVWGFIIGGQKTLGYFYSIFALLCVGYYSIQKKFSIEWIVLGISALLMIVLLKNTRTPIFESYLVFLHSFIFFITAFLIYFFYKIQKIVGIIIFCIIFLLSLQKDIHEITIATNITAKQSIVWRQLLTQKMPNATYTVYDYKYHSSEKSVPFVLFLDEQKRVKNNSLAIGVIATTEARLAFPVIAGEKGGIRLVDLRKLSKLDLKKKGWILITPEEIYRSTEDWYK